MKRIILTIQLTLLILLLPLFQGTAIAQNSDIKSGYQFSVEPPWFYEPMIWIVGLALTVLMVIVVMKELERKMG